MTSEPTVTIAIPVYKRLHFLSEALASIAAQGYGSIDLIVSDNGENGEDLPTLVEQHYQAPYRFRRNDRTVSVDQHFNQLISEARGQYFLILADDDQLGDNLVRGLVEALEEDPAVGVAIARMQAIDELGAARRTGAPEASPPLRMSGAEFVRTWCRNEYDFVTFLTVMSRTEDLRRIGGYPDFPEHGTSIDDAVILKLALGRTVAWVHEAVFHNRVYEASHGLSLPIRELARDLRRYLAFLDEDETLAVYARERPGEWSEVRALQREMTWKTYRYRWRYMYRARLGYWDWAAAAFEMPFIRPYYASVLPRIARVGLSTLKARALRRSAE